MNVHHALLIPTCLLFSACIGYSIEPHPRDVEQRSIPTLSSGACDLSIPITPLSELFDADGNIQPNPPPSGSIYAFEGTPQGLLICTQLGCDFECCDNGCGFASSCPFRLHNGKSNTSLCLAHPSFENGGTDCSSYCAPFSCDPSNTYRFIGTLTYKNPSIRREFNLSVDSFCRVDS